MPEIRLSICVPVLNSHEILRRQFLHWESVGIPENTEIIIVDDGSDPPLSYEGKLNAKIIRTNDRRAWTWALARNRGVKESEGEYVLMTDIDHILSKEAIETASKFDGDKMYFIREFGVLLEDGTLSQDPDVLASYGLPKGQGLRIGALPNNICLKKSVFYEIGGYREDLVGRAYPQGEDRSFKKAWENWARSLSRPVVTQGAPIYMFPNGYYCGDVDFNPMALFHGLSRKNKHNYRARV